MNDAGSLVGTVRERLAARPLVLLLDVDGTLSPIAPTPESAMVPQPTRDALKRLVTVPDVHVALVSGRAAADAKRMVAVEGVWAVGNHGFETITADDEHVVDPQLARFRPALVAAAAAIAPFVAQHEGTQLEDKGWTLSVHYRRAAAGVGDRLGDLLAEIAASQGLKLTAGKMVFELRPPVAVNKGSASLRLLERLVGEGGAALYAGDDRTDEDAFRTLRAARPETVTIRIQPERGEAPAETAAEFTLPDVASMGAFLERLAAEWAMARPSRPG